MRFLLLFSILIILLIASSSCTHWRLEKKYPPIGDTLLIGDQKLHYLDIGSRDSQYPPLVILHGASANLMDMKLALGDELSKTHRVILIDRPGRGYSTRPADGHNLDVQSSLIHQGLELLGIEKPIIIGQSLGGAVALNYTLNYQSKISGTVLIATVSHEWPGGVAWYNTASGIPILGFILRRTLFPISGQAVAPKGIAGTFWPQDPPQDYYEKAGIALLFRPKDFKSNAADIANLKTNIQAMQERYGEITVPVKIFVGTHDTNVSPTIHSYRLSKQIKGSEFILLENHGHGLQHTGAPQIIASIKALAVQSSLPTPEAEITPDFVE